MSDRICGGPSEGGPIGGSGRVVGAGNPLVFWDEMSSEQPTSKPIASHICGFTSDL